MAFNMLYNPATGKMIVSNTKNLYTVDPRIKIATYEDLIKIGVDDDYPIDADYLQIADIEQPSTIANHTPVSAPNSYDGGFFKISNLTYNGDYSAIGGYGLFIFSSTTSVSPLKNIVFDNLNLNINFTGGDYYIGSVAGSSSSGNYSNILLLPNCNIESNASYTGGVCGRRTGDATFDYCQTHANLTSDAVIGGICGVSAHGIFNYCLNFGSITNNDDPWCGGILGQAFAYDTMYLNNCFSACTFSTTESYSNIYALLGGNTASYTIATDCYFDSDIYLRSRLGTGLTTLESKLVSSYPTWDISYKADGLDTKFRIDISGVINDGYPYLTQFETALINGGV